MVMMRIKKGQRREMQRRSLPSQLPEDGNSATQRDLGHQRRKSRWCTSLFLTTAAVAIHGATVDAFSSVRIPSVPNFERTEHLLWAKGKRIRVVATEARDRSFEPSTQHSSGRQFMPRYMKYEIEKLHGTLPEQPNILKANPKSLPTSEERVLITDKIARLLNDEFEIEETSSQEIADRATVFAQLSDEDKSEATFAVSRDMNQHHVDSEPMRIKNLAKKGKLTANVMETGRDTMKQYAKSMSNHQVLSPEDEAVLGRHIQVLVKWEEQRQQLEHNLLRYVRNCLCCIYDLLLRNMVLTSFSFSNVRLDLQHLWSGPIRLI
jgi:hypothetical protein